MAVGVPAILLAVAAGTALARAMFGTSVTGGGGSASVGGGPVVEVAAVTAHVPYAWGPIGLVVAVAVGAVAVTVGVGLLFLKSSTSVEELRTA